MEKVIALLRDAERDEGWCAHLRGAVADEILELGARRRRRPRHCGLHHLREPGALQFEFAQNVWGFSRSAMPCMGGPLARLEVNLALEIFLRAVQPRAARHREGWGHHGGIAEYPALANQP